MSIGQNIKRRRRELDMTLEDVARDVGVSRQTLSRYETGIIGNIPSDKIELLAKSLKTTPAYLMGWDDRTYGTLRDMAEDMAYSDKFNALSKEKKLLALASVRDLPQNVLPLPHLSKKPRLGTIACGKPILAVEDAEAFDDVPDTFECDFTLLCKGDSMINARIFDGDIVYIRQQPEVENGEIAAVRIGDEATLKKVYYTPGSDRITLRACNPMYQDLEYEGGSLDEIEILGKAIAFTSTIR